MNIEYITQRLEALRMRESFEVRETAMRLIALTGMYTKDTITPVILYLQHQGQEGKILAKAMEEIFELSE